MADAERELRRLDAEWVDALIQRDHDALDRLMADDFLFTYPMAGDSKTQFISDIDSGNLLVEYIKRTNVDVNVFGSTATITALDDAKWRYHGRQILGTYRVLHVYTNRNSRWELVAVQACPVT
jgi:ketosteroid isomerase-like protein